MYLKPYSGFDSKNCIREKKELPQKVTPERQLYIIFDLTEQYILL